MTASIRQFIFFFFNDTATTEIYTLSLHDALPISSQLTSVLYYKEIAGKIEDANPLAAAARSEEHTSELQSRPHLVCRLLLEKKKNMVLPGTPNTRRAIYSIRWCNPFIFSVDYPKS